jgi:hypothetical protein
MDSRNSNAARDARRARYRSGKRKLTPGTRITHPTYGAGQVVGEWGSLTIKDSGNRLSTDCSGIYDVIFGSSPHLFLHCCRGEYLERVL